MVTKFPPRNLTRADRTASVLEDIWTKEVEPIADRLREAGLTVNRNTFGSGAFSEKLQEAAPALTTRDRILARSAGDRYSNAATALVRASERLGEAGADHAVAVLFPKATVVTSGDKTPGKA